MCLRLLLGHTAKEKSMEGSARVGGNDAMVETDMVLCSCRFQVRMAGNSDLISRNEIDEKWNNY